MRSNNVLHFKHGELCTWFDKLKLSFFFFPFIEKLYTPVCSTVPTSLQAGGRRLKDCIHLSLSPIYLYLIPGLKSWNFLFSPYRTKITVSSGTKFPVHSDYYDSVIIFCHNITIKYRLFLKTIL